MGYGLTSGPMTLHDLEHSSSRSRKLHIKYLKMCDEDDDGLNGYRTGNHLRHGLLTETTTFDLGWPWTLLDQGYWIFVTNVSKMVNFRIIYRLFRLLLDWINTLALSRLLFYRMYYFLFKNSWFCYILKKATSTQLAVIKKRVQQLGQQSISITC